MREKTIQIFDNFTNSASSIGFDVEDIKQKINYQPSGCSAKLTLNPLRIENTAIRRYGEGSFSRVYLACEEEYQVGGSKSTPEYILKKSNVQMAFLRKSKGNSFEFFFGFHSDYDSPTTPFHPVFHLQITPHLRMLASVTTQSGVYRKFQDVNRLRIPTSRLNFIDSLMFLSSFIMTDIGMFNSFIEYAHTNNPLKAKKIKNSEKCDWFLTNHWYNN